MNLRAHASRPILLIALLAGAVIAAGCTIIGEGELHVQNDLSGIGADNTVLSAMVADEGDPWPPPGAVTLAVRGDDFGSPPDYGMDGYVYLVSTDLACPMTEAGPETFALEDVIIRGIVTVVDGTVNQFLLMPDDPANRQPTWALIDFTPISPDEPGHYIHRCGAVTWS